MRQEHSFGPFYDKDSEILILGSFPSVKSREQQFYYGHPQNRFWKVLAAVFDTEVPESLDEKKQFLSENHIALWDVIESCEITGSSDSSIRDVVVTDLDEIFRTARIRKIFVNGGTAYRFFEKYQKPVCRLEARKLPSTSPANAAWSLERLIREWKIVVL